MSKLIKMFERTGEAAVQPMGFKSSRAAVAPSRLVLIAEVQEPAAADAIEAADAIVIAQAKTKLNGKDLETITSGLQDKPWGVADGTTRAGKLPQGCDFVLISALTQVNAIPENDEIGKVLQLESSMDDGLLRAVNDLPVDAIVIADSMENDGALNWHQLMIIRHVTHLVSVPVIVPVPATITGAELKALCEAGVNGVLLDAAATTAGTLQNIKDLITKLPARSSKKKRKPEASLPRIGYREPGAELSDEDDDWD